MKLWSSRRGILRAEYIRRVEDGQSALWLMRETISERDGTVDHKSVGDCLQTSATDKGRRDMRSEFTEHLSITQKADCGRSTSLAAGAYMKEMKMLIVAGISFQFMCSESRGICTHFLRPI